MNLRIAAKHNLQLIEKNGLGQIVAADQADDGKGAGHALWMLNKIVDGQIDGEKGHRWLGYAQGVLVSEGFLSLEQAKIANVLS